MRKETFRSLACGAVALGYWAYHRDEPERALFGVIVFCLVTVVLDYALKDDRPKALRHAVTTDIEAQRQAMAIRSQEAAEWLKGKRP